MEPFDEVSIEVQAQPRFDVFPKRSKPMPLSLSGGTKGFVPESVRHIMTQTLDDDVYLRLMPRPVP